MSRANTYYNGVLALYGAWLREQAEVRGLGFVDMYSPLNAITAQQDPKKKADWTMIADGVHPGPVGQTVMAVAVIDNIVALATVSQITVADKAGKLAALGANGKLTDFQQNRGRAELHLRCQLPPVGAAPRRRGRPTAHRARPPLQQREGHRARPEQRMSLKIDGAVVGQYEAGALAKGVELQGNDKTPQYQQALKVALLNKQRNDLAYHPLRDQYAQLKGKRRELAKVPATDPQYHGQESRVRSLVHHAESQGR